MVFDKSMLRLLTSTLFVLMIQAANAQENCFKVDLQAVAISPVNFKLDPGKSTQVEVVMLNNGPCPLPKGQATAQITINTEHLEVPSNIAFTDPCNRWTYLTSTTTGNLQNLFFRNNAADLPVGGKSCGFRFTVKAKPKSAGVSTITLASSLSGTATTADMNGNNQSAFAEIEIAGKAGQKIPEKKPVVTLNAKASDCNVILTWQAISKNVDSIWVEAGKDKSDFNKIAVLQPKDATGDMYKYETDQGNNHLYYRVKVIYKDLTFDYSSTPEVETKCKTKKGFQP